MERPAKLHRLCMHESLENDRNNAQVLLQKHEPCIDVIYYNLGEATTTHTNQILIV